MKTAAIEVPPMLDLITRPAPVAPKTTPRKGAAKCQACGKHPEKLGINCTDTLVICDSCDRANNPAYYPDERYRIPGTPERALFDLENEIKAEITPHAKTEIFAKEFTIGGHTLTAYYHLLHISHSAFHDHELHPILQDIVSNLTSGKGKIHKADIRFHVDDFTWTFEINGLDQ